MKIERNIIVIVLVTVVAVFVCYTLFFRPKVVAPVIEDQTTVPHGQTTTINNTNDPDYQPLAQ
jgi:hypothetical protein